MNNYTSWRRLWLPLINLGTLCQTIVCWSKWYRSNSQTHNSFQSVVIYIGINFQIIQKNLCFHLRNYLPSTVIRDLGSFYGILEIFYDGYIYYVSWKSVRIICQIYLVIQFTLSGSIIVSGHYKKLNKRPLTHEFTSLLRGKNSSILAQITLFLRALSEKLRNVYAQLTCLLPY